MKVFIAGIIQGSKVQAAIHRQDWRDGIKEVIARALPEAKVYCHYSEHPNSIAYELPEIRTTMADGNKRAGESDLLIAYVPSASMGTAIEMYLAATAGAVVLTISPLAANWVIRAYSDRVFADIAAFEKFMQSDQLARLIDGKPSR